MTDTASTEDEYVSEDESDSTSACSGNWNYVPDSILLHIFQYLTARELLNVGLTCKTWLRVCYDEFLWKDLVYSHFQIDPSISNLPGKHSWLQDYKRLTYHTPVVQTEVLKEHSHQVLHVSFAHNGKLFATCSKDGSVLVWDSGYPAKIKYQKDMKTFFWKYTQFCQFNPSDTLLLVSGVHFGTPHSTSGEIAVFSLQDGFTLQRRVVNKPYDIFGTWYNDHYLLSGDLHWMAHLVSCSVLWLNNTSPETPDHVMTQLYKFYNCNASSIRAVMVANCLSHNKEISNDNNDSKEKNLGQSSVSKHVRGNPPSHRDITHSLKSVDEFDLHLNINEPQCSTQEGSSLNWKSLGEGLEYASPIFYNQDYRKVETESQSFMLDSQNESINEELCSLSDDCPVDVEVGSETSETSVENDYGGCEDFSEGTCEKLLIFTTGSKTYTPHQIGFKRIKSIAIPKERDNKDGDDDKEKKNFSCPPKLDPKWVDYETIGDNFDKVDHLIDLHGHIIGMGLSPDHRYLYVNNRPWPQGCVIENPLNPPPIAQEIDIHVIDLVTLKEVGTMLRAHKAYTPNNECFFIFLNVCNEYVASGAEDKHGYLWDRHYGICLAKYPHADVVNSVAFNPKDPEMLVTTSDDYTIKIWRSKHRVKQLKIENGEDLPRGIEIRLRNKKN